MALICVPQLVVSLFSRWSWPVRTLICVALFPVAGGVVALIYGWIDGYWKHV